MVTKLKGKREVGKKEGKNCDSGLAQVCHFSDTECRSRKIANWWSVSAKAG